jgi:prevent-host-death family protein
MVISASDFKARCLALIDRVHDRGEPVVITKRGRVVARLVPAGDADARPWTQLQGTARFVGDATAPAIDESDIESIK